jgi:AraC-like DNA-binding protein
VKLLATEITPFIKSSFSIEYRERNFFSSPFHTQPAYHSHPELELDYIIEGYGKRVIGNKVESFDSGDMVFIGSNVPHIWLSDQTFYKEDSVLSAKSIVTYINPQIFNEALNKIAELATIKSMIEKSSRGIKISGETRDQIGRKLITCIQKSGYEKFEELMQIMHLISISKDISLIIDEKTITGEFYQSTDRLIEVLNYIKRNFSNAISLKEMAQIACMTEQSFCRYFRSRTKKSFSEYLFDERMAHALSLLIETDKSISDIAFLCGYNSASRFCQVFKNKYGQSPHQQRTNFRKNISLPKIR